MQTPPPVVLDSSFELSTTEPFTRAMARAAGVGKKRLAALVDDGYLRRPIRNVYVASQVADGIALRAQVLGLVVPPDCFVCDRTAAWLHGAPAALAPDEHLLVPTVSCFRLAEHGRLRNKLTDSGERAVTRRDLMVIDGIAVTTPLRTALDLGRLQRTRDTALSGMDAMLRLELFPHEQLLAKIPRFARQRGVVRLRVLAPLADGRSQSPGESALRLRWYDAGLPRPELQIPVLENGRVVYWLDMGLEELLFAAEYDGEEWHSSADQREHDRGRRSWLGERSWEIEVFRKDSVYGHDQDADVRLAAAVRAARASLGRRKFVT